jgi:CHAD domain-containing protein
MAGQFKRKESVSKAVRRVGCKRIKVALKALEHCEQAEAIHAVRKQIKQLRSLLKLVRPCVKNKVRRRLAKRLRKAAHHLAPLRDAQVDVSALKNLTNHCKRDAAPGTLRNLKVLFHTRLEVEAKHFNKSKKPHRVKNLFGNLHKETAGLKVRGRSWKAIGPGLRESYAKGLAAFQTARRHSTPENLHEWRKRAKDLWYQVRFLRGIWPEQMDAAAHELEELTETLGDDHDLEMLKHSVCEHDSLGASAKAVERLGKLITQRQSKLRCAALGMGNRFYSEKPETFCQRLQTYWQTWRGEPLTSRLKMAARSS